MEFFEYLKSNFKVDKDKILISKPKFYSTDESEYDNYYGIEYDKKAIFQIGKNIKEFLISADVPKQGIVLEIGCGTGRLSCPLIAGTNFDGYFITDISDQFIDITRNKIKSLEVSNKQIYYGALSGEDLPKLPPGKLVSIFYLGVLHHIEDWRKSLLDAVKLLKKGGVVIINEPCLEAQMITAILLKNFAGTVDDKKIPIDKNDRKRIDWFANAILVRGCPDYEKSNQEDKHIFRIDEILSFAADNKLKFRYWPHGAMRKKPISKGKFSDILRQKLIITNSFSERFAEAFFLNMRSEVGFLDKLYSCGIGPFYNFLAILKKVDE